MLYRLISNKKTTLYDGLEKGFFTSLVVINLPDGTSFEAVPYRLLEDSLFHWRDQWDEGIWNQVLHQGELKYHSQGKLEWVDGKWGLNTYGIDWEPYWIAVSGGERQPGRYQVVLEGIWEVGG